MKRPTTSRAPGSNLCAFCGAHLAPGEASRITAQIQEQIRVVTRCVDEAACKARRRQNLAAYQQQKGETL